MIDIQNLVDTKENKENSSPKKSVNVIDEDIPENIPEGQVLMSGQKLKELQKLQKENEEIIKKQEQQNQQNE